MDRLNYRKERNTANVVIVDHNSALVFHSGDYNKRIVARSTVKPIQALPVFLLGLDKKYGLSSAELAIMSSSQLAQSQHVQTLKQILEKTDIREEDIEIEASVPSGKIAYELWRKEHASKRKVYHPCVGNHIGLMLVQRELTGKTDQYRSSDSLVQKWVTELIAEFGEYSKDRIELVSDSCGVPSYVMPMKNIAIIYKNMICGGDKLSPSVHEAVIANNMAIWENPLMIEGDGCLSTIVSSYKGLLAKTGAGGLLAVGIEKKAYGVLIQAAQGDWSSVAFALDQTLKYFGLYNRRLSLELCNI